MLGRLPRELHQMPLEISHIHTVPFSPSGRPVRREGGLSASRLEHAKGGLREAGERNSFRLVSHAVHHGSMFKNLLYRLVGAPPPPEASREERLRWVRRFYRFSLIAIVLLVILAAVFESTFLWVAAAAIAVWWVVGLTSISMSIRRSGTSSE